MNKRNKCPINPKTKEMFECYDCPIKDRCLEDMCDNFSEYVIRGAAKLGKKISKILKEQKGI